MNHVLKFSSNGTFIKRIGNPGRGPGEISRISSMSVISDKRLLVIHCRNKLMYFSFNGDLVKSADIPYHQEVKVLNDSRYIAFDPATNGSERYNFILANNKGDTISTVTNYTNWKKAYPGYLTVLTPQIAGHNLKNKLGLIKFGNHDNNTTKIYT
jgi:hypothetical protein